VRGRSLEADEAKRGFRTIASDGCHPELDSGSASGHGSQIIGIPERMIDEPSWLFEIVVAVATDPESSSG
jgi:hypothetical protein